MSGLLTLPGLIDCHVHFREPGLTHKEDLASGAAAALAGGITTVCDMPNTNPPTCTVDALRGKVKRWQEIRNSNIEIRNIDVRFFFGVTKREHLTELEMVLRDEELRGYLPGAKLYFGRTTGDLMADRSFLPSVFEFCAHHHLPLVCHCEDQEVIERNMKEFAEERLEAHSQIRSVDAATKAVALAIDLARTYGTHLHVAHLSSLDELALVRQAKESRLPVTCEVSPRHLFLTTADYAVLGTFAKVNPPLRTRDHCEALWEGLLDGSIDCLGSDHAPHTRDEKSVEDWRHAPAGSPEVETMVPLLLSCVFGDGPIDSQGHSRLPSAKSQLPLATFRKLLFDNPNRIFHLGRSLEDPPHISIDPSVEWVISAKSLHSKCGWTPYEGWRVRGHSILILQAPLR